MKMLRDPLFWLIALFVALIFWLPYSQPLFAALQPAAVCCLTASRCLLPCSHNCHDPFISKKVLQLWHWLISGWWEFRVCLR